MLVINSKEKRSRHLLRKLGNSAFGIRMVDYNKGGKEILQGIVKNKELPVLIINTPNGPMKTSKFKFGKIPSEKIPSEKIPSEKMVLPIDTLPAGNKGEHIPMTGWSAYSYDANRGGNANGCSDWLFKDRPASMRAKYGKFHQRSSENSQELYNKRGKDGFDLVPRSIYGSGNVFLHDYTQPSGAPLPRPYGPRDQAHLRGMPRPSRFGSLAPNSFGSEFIPNPKRTYKPAYVTYANDSLYLPGFRPSDAENNKIKNTVAKINQKRMLGMGKRSRFGMLPLSYGPNNVGYENPFLMYDGAGGNTLNYLTGKNYLPPCTDRSFNKVQKNNNPTGYLASFGKSRMAFGADNHWSTPSGPWVMKDNLRPQTTASIDPVSGVTSSGPTRLAQPLKLYAYQNTPLASDKYPEFLGSRSWYGGYGRRKKSITNEYGKKKKVEKEVKKELAEEKTQLKKKKKVLKQKNTLKETEKVVEKTKLKKKKRKFGSLAPNSFGQKNIFDAIANIKEGDTIDIKNGKLSIKKNKEK